MSEEVKKYTMKLTRFDILKVAIALGQASRKAEEEGRLGLNDWKGVTLLFENKLDEISRRG